MINTGIIRKIDELGRIVLPKELRKTMNINAGDDFKIILENEKIILEKYSMLNNIEDKIDDIINCFSSVTNYKIYLVVNNKIIENNENVLDEISKIIQERKIYINEKNNLNNITDNIIDEGKMVIFPIVLDSDLLGAIILISNDDINEIINYAKIINNIIKKLLLLE